ncbi:DUF922 domain-containing protein [Mesorhizobium sp. B2-6-2]|uniref:DUF922 domain-containing protein n=1 Tax=Mesorhizobium sp. B2-6-2 TaxID=2589915 RepID=UPI0015E33D77|nr:DUF922 domain-containing protein [Mesorhizobium sp. B2-6-2]
MTVRGTTVRRTASFVFAAFTLPCIIASSAEAKVSLIRRDTPHAIEATTPEEIGSHFSFRDRNMATTFRREVVFAVRRPATCFVPSAHYTLTQVATHPRLIGNISPELRRRWNGLDAAVKSSRDKAWSWAVQAAYEMEAATANVSMNGDPTCRKLKSLVKKRLDAIQENFHQRSELYGNQLNGPGGAMSKAAERFYKQP